MCDWDRSPTGMIIGFNTWDYSWGNNDYYWDVIGDSNWDDTSTIDRVTLWFFNSSPWKITNFYLGKPR